jgi:hypothetical protein
MFHHSNLGHFGSELPCDRNGYVPEVGDSPSDFDMEFSDKEEKEWWETEKFPEWVEDAVTATEAASEKLYAWQNKTEYP